MFPCQNDISYARRVDVKDVTAEEKSGVELERLRSRLLQEAHVIHTAAVRATKAVAHSEEEEKEEAQVGAIAVESDRLADMAGIGVDREELDFEQLQSEFEGLDQDVDEEADDLEWEKRLSQVMEEGGGIV